MTSSTRVALLAAMLLLSACGFQLRGSAQTTVPFASMHVTQPEASPLGAELRRYLRISGNARVVDDPKAAEAILEILSESRSRNIRTLSSQGRIREISLIYTVRLQVRSPAGAMLLPPSDITLARDLTFNESLALAKEREEELLYRDMQSDAVQQILRRLSALKPA